MNLKQFLSPQPNSSEAEKIVSSLGAVISISLIFYISYRVTGYSGAMAILPSMGAAVVLLFAVPHGALSQPWALFFGNILSAVIGVASAKWVPNIFLSAGVAVGFSIGAMHLFRCIHPPGGATALAAVIGGEGIRQLGFSFVLYPTLLNCFVIFFVALLFNNLFAWRRYPLALMHYHTDTSDQPRSNKVLTQHIEQAVHDLDLVVDISAEQIKSIVEAADIIRRESVAYGFDLDMGAFYTNGLPGRDWGVRQLIDHRPHDDPLKHRVIYRTVEGSGKGRNDSCTLDEFANWASEKMRPRKSDEKPV